MFDNPISKGLGEGTVPQSEKQGGRMKVEDK